MEVAAKQDPIEGSPISATNQFSIRCVTPSWRLPASRACFGIEDRTLSISFEEFLEPKSRPRPSLMRSPVPPTAQYVQRAAPSNCYGNSMDAIASEQAFNRLSDKPQNRLLTGYRTKPVRSRFFKAGLCCLAGIPSEQGINREVSARASEAIGAIDRSRAQFNEAYLEDLVSWSGRRWACGDGGSR